MAIIEETDKSKRGERERWMAPEVSKAVLTPKIINFEQGRKALEKRALEEEQSRVRLIRRGAWEAPGQRPVLPQGLSGTG